MNSSRIILLALLAGVMVAGAQQPQPPSLFALISVDREKIYAGEPFTLLLAIHVRDMNLDKEITVSGLNDQLELEPPDELPVEYKTFGTRVYEIRRYRYAARALLPGTFTLHPVLAGRVVTVEQSFVFTRRQIQPVAIPVQARTISVKSVPTTGRPGDFSGVIGRDITLAASIEPTDVAVGELITVTTLIAGTGIRGSIPPPRLTIGPYFKTYPAKPLKNTSTGAAGFSQIAIPTATNATALGPVTFTYFDTRAEQYRELSQGPFPVTFHPEHQMVIQVYRPPAAGQTNGGSMQVVSVPQQDFARQPEASRWRRWLGRIGFGRDTTQRAIVIKSPVEARFAPSPNARVLGKIPPDTTVAITGADAEWLRVVTPGGDAGWIPRTSVTVIH